MADARSGAKRNLEARCQNRAGRYWTEDEVHDGLRKVMKQQFHEVHARMQKNNLDMRTAAYALALDRLGDALSARG